jgi:hypothetical protein
MNQFFYPEDFRRLMNDLHDDDYLCLVAADKANAKLESRVKEIFKESGTQFLLRLIINENFKQAKHDEAVVEAKALAEYILKSNPTDQDGSHDEINNPEITLAKKWLEKWAKK